MSQFPKLLALALPIGLLAGCGDPAPQQPAPRPSESGYIARVRALPAGQRDGVLLRAIHAGGGAACQGVGKVEDMPAAKDGRPTWRVSCEEGSQWLVTLGDDGTALVTGARTG